MNISRFMTALLACAALVVSSCDEKEPQVVVPVFPEIYVNEDVAPGDVIEVTFTPNMDGVVSIPVETFEWYWLLDGTFKYRELDVLAGVATTLRIAVSEIEEKSTERICELTLTMGGRTEVIARLVRPATEKKLSVFSAHYEDGTFEMNSEGGFAYGESTEELHLVWTGTDFRLPIKVDANFSWSVEFPEWLKGDVPVSKYGVTTFNLYGVPSKLPLEDTEGEIAFKYKNDVVKKVKVNIPGCKDILSYTVKMSLAQLEFSSAGYLKSSTGYIDEPAEVYVFGPENVRVLIVGKVNGLYKVEQPLWIQTEISDYVHGGDVLQNRTVKITVSEYSGSKNQEAYVFILPATVSEDISYRDLFESDAATILEEYSGYAIKLVQNAHTNEYVIPDSEPLDRALKAVTFEKSTDVSWSAYTYEVTYAKAWSQDEGYVHLTSPYSTLKVYDSEKRLVDESKTAGYWCTFDAVETRMYGRITLDEEQIPVTDAVAYFEFADAEGNTLGVIKFAFDPEKIPDISNIVVDVKFADENKAEDSGATLTEVTEGVLFDEYKEYQCPIYHLKYTQENIPMKLIIPASATCYSPNPWKYWKDLLVNDLNFEEEVGRMELIDGGIFVRMKMPDDATDNVFRGGILFYNAKTANSANNENIVFVLVCTLDLTESAE